MSSYEQKIENFKISLSNTIERERGKSRFQIYDPNLPDGYELFKEREYETAEILLAHLEEICPEYSVTCRVDGLGRPDITLKLK